MTALITFRYFSLIGLLREVYQNAIVNILEKVLIIQNTYLKYSGSAKRKQNIQKWYSFSVFLFDIPICLDSKLGSTIKVTLW